MREEEAGRIARELHDEMGASLTALKMDLGWVERHLGRHLEAEPGAPLRARLAEAGVDGSLPVVTSCGSGVTACILTLGLRIAGFPEGAVYDGSWTEWGGRSDTPVEVG